MDINATKGGSGNALRALARVRKQHSKLIYALVLCLVVLPVLLQGWMVLQYSVNVPYRDDWHVIPMLEEFARGTLSFDDVFAQTNDSRLFFPNLVIIAVAYLTHYDVRYEMLISLLLACLISFNVYYLGKQTIAASLLKRLLILFLANLFVFAPIQATNWLWGIAFV